MEVTHCNKHTRYAYPYLWKQNKSDNDYKEAWGDPRLPKEKKEEEKVKPPTIQKKNQGRGM